jgi:hypothetical protein
VVLAIKQKSERIQKPGEGISATNIAMTCTGETIINDVSKNKYKLINSISSSNLNSGL